jgi:hypothetical protein
MWTVKQKPNNFFLNMFTKGNNSEMIYARFMYFRSASEDTVINEKRKWPEDRNQVSCQGKTLYWVSGSVLNPSQC